MLRTTRSTASVRTLWALVALVFLAPVLAIAPSQSARADYVICNGDPINPQCEVVIEDGGAPGDPATDPETGVTPGPTECLAKQDDGNYVRVDCVSSNGHWSNDSQCYWQVRDPAQFGELAPPPGADPLGAWYLCTPVTGTGGIIVGTAHWLVNPPPGLTLTPGQAAQRIVQNMQFFGINMGIAPEVNPRLAYRRGFVGVPVWLWAANQNAQNWGPYTITATLGGQTITVDARVTSVLWNMGDGHTVACGTAGTAYSTSYGVVDSPTCGHRYSTTSDTNGGHFTVTATSQWAVTWTGGGQSGTIPLTAQSSDNIWIDEAQSVNVNPSN